LQACIGVPSTRSPEHSRAKRSQTWSAAWRPGPRCCRRPSLAC
jgi:hypothetical protein